MIVFEYTNGKKEEYDNWRVTPYHIRSQNPSYDTIAMTLENKKAWLILPEKKDGLEGKVINPHQIVSITRK